MKTTKLCTVTLTLILTLTPLTMISSTSVNANQSESAGDSKPKAAFSVAVGDEGVHYTASRSEENEITGPASLRIGPDGTFLIADTVGKRILRYRPDGSSLDPIPVEDSVGITDIAANGSDIFAFDEAAINPTVIRISPDGAVAEKVALSPNMINRGISGISIGADGRVVTEIRDGDSIVALDISAQTSDAQTATPQLAIQTPDLSDKAVDHSTGLVGKDRNRIIVQVDNILGGLNVIGSTAEGDFFVLVEELSNTHRLYVDQTVRHYSASGAFLGVARVPLADRYTYVAHGVAVAPAGKVYALVTRADGADVVPLHFKRRLSPILPKGDGPTEIITPAIATMACSRTRDQMISTASSYAYNQMYLTSTNLNGSCVGRIKPHYLGVNAGTYPSVPYCWGGFELPTEYNDNMSRGYIAGDLNSSRISSCPHGVDCSGFVSRCWGTSRYTTTTLPSISTATSVALAQKGDILNLSGSHVAMIESFVTNGVMTYEATAYNNYDRVVYIYNGWSRFNGYSFYRYNNVCDTAAPARPVVTSSLTLSSAGPYYVGQTLYGYFTITNRGSQSITLQRLLIGGRLNGDTGCSGGCPDFSLVTNVSLSPGQSYYYSGSRYLDRAGAYSFFVAYQKSDGSWVTNVDSENGAANSRSITVQNLPVGPPSLSSYSPIPLYARTYNQTVYFYGQRLTNTTAMYVYFPNGGGTYIYPPSQIPGRSYSTLQTYVTLSGRGWYTFYAYTSDGGWSNGYSIWVN